MVSISISSLLPSQSFGFNGLMQAGGSWLTATSQTILATSEPKALKSVNSAPATARLRVVPAKVSSGKRSGASASACWPRSSCKRQKSSTSVPCTALSQIGQHETSLKSTVLLYYCKITHHILVADKQLLLIAEKQLLLKSTGQLVWYCYFYWLLTRRRMARERRRACYSCVIKKCKK